VTQVQGTVQRVWCNRRADGSKYWVFSIDGRRYSTWNRDMAEGIRVGDRVEFAFTDSGRYRNLTALTRLPASRPWSADSLGMQPKSLRVVRMNCLRIAAELVKETTLLPEQKLAIATTMAKRLERHVLRTEGTFDGTDCGAEDRHKLEGENER